MEKIYISLQALVVKTGFQQSCISCMLLKCQLYKVIPFYSCISLFYVIAVLGERSGILSIKVSVIGLAKRL